MQIQDVLKTKRILAVQMVTQDCKASVLALTYVKITLQIWSLSIGQKQHQRDQVENGEKLTIK